MGNGTVRMQIQPARASSHDFNDNALMLGASGFRALFEGRNARCLQPTTMPRSASTIVSEADFASAREEISAWSGYAPTPLHRLASLADTLGLGGILYKNEGSRFGSFKALGGPYAALRVLQRALSERLNREVAPSEIRAGRLAAQASGITVVSATDGNHGRSALRRALPDLCPPEGVSEGRAQTMRKSGAEVVRIDGDYDRSVCAARREAEDNGWFLVSDTSWEGYVRSPTDVMAGYGLIVDEVADQ